MAYVGVGHNINAIQLAKEVTDRLARDYAALGTVPGRMVEALTQLPKEITGPADQAKHQALLVQVRERIAEVTAAQEDELKPVRINNRAISAWFSSIVEDLTAVCAAINQRNTDYLLKVEEQARAERERAAAEARQKAEEARAAAEAAAERAKAATSPEMARRYQRVASGSQHDAESFEDRARQQLMEASAPAAVLTRTKTDAGQSQLRTTWECEITDFAAVPLEKLREYFGEAKIEQAVKAYVREYKDKTDLPGVRVFPKKTAVTRK